MAVKEKDKDTWKHLPGFVILNPRAAAMFDDREMSGMYLAQWDAKDSEGNEIKSWGHVPKENNCSRVQKALDMNLIFQCNPSGESRLVPSPLIKEDSIDSLMQKNSREIIALLPNIHSLDLLSKMRAIEEAKGKRERRTIVLQELATRMKESNVSGVSNVQAVPAMIRDSSGKMIPDTIKLN